MDDLQALLSDLMDPLKCQQIAKEVSLEYQNAPATPPVVDKITFLDSSAYKSLPIPTAEKKQKKQKKKPVQKTPYFERPLNLLDESNHKFLELPTVSEKLENTSCTMITLSATLLNVDFVENELIEKLNPSKKIPVIRCNYGEKIYESYKVVAPIRRSNRGRKPKPRPPQTRRKQGSGREFNSQITFSIASNQYDEIPLPVNPLVFHVKLFRNGEIQIPGATIATLKDVIEACNHLSKFISEVLGHECPLVYIGPIIQNFKSKFVLKNQQLDLPNITKFIKSANESAPKISSVIHDRDTCKTVVHFHTPTTQKPEKATRVDIRLSGKIGILGSPNSQHAKEILNFLTEILERPESRFDIRSE